MVSKSYWLLWGVTAGISSTIVKVHHLRRTGKKDEIRKIIARAALHGCSAYGPHSCATRYSARSCHAAVHDAPALVKCNHASAPGCKPQSAPQPACSGGQGSRGRKLLMLVAVLSRKAKGCSPLKLCLCLLWQLGINIRYILCIWLHLINERLSAMHSSFRKPGGATMEGNHDGAAEGALSERQMGPLTATRGFGFSESH